MYNMHNEIYAETIDVKLDKLLQSEYTCVTNS